MTQLFPCPYLGGSVELTEERQQHIHQNHPQILPDRLSELAETLDHPDQIRPSAFDPAALLFSKWFDTIRTGRYFVVVVVTDPQTQRHWIVTAYTARKLRGDNIL